MKILFVNAYFAPEKTAFSHLEADLIDSLVSEGHEIEVLCPTPSRGVSKDVLEKYKAMKNEELYGGKVHVKRFSAPKEGKNPIARALRYFWCNLREYQIGKRYKGIDAVFAVSTPPTQGLLAGKLSKKLKCPFVYSLQDVFPDSLVTTGLAKEGSLVWKIGSRIEKKTYEHADKIVVISEACKNNLLKKGVKAGKLSLISNWVDIDSVKPVLKSDNRLFSELGIKTDKFTVLYAGNFGEAQGAEIVLDSAELLKDKDDIQFVIFGGGAHFESAKERTENMLNVFIHDLLPEDRVSEAYSLGDVALITCKAGVGSSGMPSKTWSIMACNTPIIASFDTDSELAEILDKSGAGICVEAGNAETLAEAICKCADGGNMTSGGRQYVMDNASKEMCVKRYIDLITRNAVDEMKK